MDLLLSRTEIKNNKTLRNVNGLLLLQIYCLCCSNPHFNMNMNICWHLSKLELIGFCFTVNKHLLHTLFLIKLWSFSLNSLVNAFIVRLRSCLESNFQSVYINIKLGRSISKQVHHDNFLTSFRIWTPNLYSTYDSEKKLWYISLAVDSILGLYSTAIYN